MFKVAVGHSDDPDTLDAIKEAMGQCKPILNGKKPNAGVLIVSSDYDPAIALKYINDEFPGIELVGATSSGELSSSLGYMEGSVLLALFCSDRVNIQAGVIRELSKGDLQDAQKMLKDAKLIMTFPEVFTIGLVKVLKKMEAVVGKDIPIVGAGASDMQFKFTKTSQFYKTEVLHDSAPFLVFTGPLRYAIFSSSGWNPFSSVKLIFNHKDNVISKIGEYSALDFFKHYLGGPPTLAYPLAIFQDKEKEDSFFLRAPIGVDEQSGTVTMGADIPEAEMACSIAKAESDELIKVMKGVIEKAHEQKPAYNFAFIASCACRQAVLGTKVKKESEVINQYYSADMPCFGLYSYGQMGRLETNGRNLVFNETVVVVAMGEDNG